MKTRIDPNSLSELDPNKQSFSANKTDNNCNSGEFGVKIRVNSDRGGVT